MSRIDYFLSRTFNRRQTVLRQVAKVRSRLLQRRDMPSVFVNSIPKSGTHLIASFFSELEVHQDSGFFLSDLQRGYEPVTAGETIAQLSSIKPGYLTFGHLKYNEDIRAALASQDFRVLLMARDPRDTLISQYHHAMNREGNRLHAVLSSLPTRYQRLKTMIEGVAFQDGSREAPFFDDFKAYFRWKDSDVCLVRFEDLVGEQGGGTSELQKRTAARIADFCAPLFASNDIEIGNTEKAEWNIFDRQSNTFRSGRAGSWKEDLDSAEIDLINISSIDAVRAYVNQ